MSRVFAYCRVSTTGQTVENQVREIEAAGFNIDARRIVIETVSGSTASAQRAGFMKLTDRLEADDVLVVTKLDRLGRNLLDIRQTVDRLSKLGVRLHCLQLGGMDLTSPGGKMIMGVMGAFAEFERDLLIERTQSGLSRAKSQGKTLGRKALLSAKDKEVVRSKLEAGSSISAVAKAHGVSRLTIMRAKNEGLSAA